MAKSEMAVSGPVEALMKWTPPFRRVGFCCATTSLVTPAWPCTSRQGHKMGETSKTARLGSSLIGDTPLCTEQGYPLLTI